MRPPFSADRHSVALDSDQSQEDKNGEFNVERLECRQIDRKALDQPFFETGARYVLDLSH